MTEYRTCHGKMSGGRSCYFRAVVKRGRYWYCRTHDPFKKKLRETEKKKREAQEAKLIPIEDLRKLYRMCRYYDRYQTLGRGVDLEKLWANTVPRLVEEIATLRNIPVEKLLK